jgi:hypothetical protein
MPIKNNLSEINQDHVKTGKSISFSFDVPSLGIIYCTRVLRAIQGKRITCLGDFGSHKVIVKLFSMLDEPRTIGSAVIKDATNLLSVPSQLLIYFFPDIFMNMGFT